MKKTLLLMSLYAVLVHTSCNTTEAEKEKEMPTRYFVTSPLQADTAYTKDYVAQIRSVRNIEVRAQEKGYLEKIYVDEGQFVKAGQLLFKIMPKIYEAEMLKADAEAKEAEIEVQNTRPLVEKNVVSKNELAMANARLDKARAELALAKTHLAFTEIRAPFDGIIDRLPLKLGSLVDEGELLTSLSDNSQMFAYFNVSEPEYLNYEANLKNHKVTTVQLLMANNQVFSYPGKVETIEGEFNNETGNIAFRAKFPNPDKLLRHGETGKVLMATPLKNALILPQKATYEIQDKRYVFLVDKDGVLHSREITVAAELPDLFVVGSGITANDHVLLEGLQKAKDNDKISYDFKEPKEVVAHLRLKAE